MLVRFSSWAAGLAACSLFGAAVLAQEPAPSNPQVPNATSEDEQPADAPSDDSTQPGTVAPGEPVNSAPELPAPNGDSPSPQTATQPNPQPAPVERDRTQPADRGDAEAARDARSEARDDRQDLRDDRRDDVRDRADDRRDDRTDRRLDRRGAPDIGLTFNSTAAGALVIDQIGPRYFQDAGFRRGDRIVSASGRRFNDPADFYVWLGTVPVGQRVPIIVLRDGRETTVYWTPSAEFVEMYAQQAPAGAVRFLGIHVDEQVQNAVVVARVDRNSAAERGGIAAGDVVVSVNNQEVRSPREFADAVASVSPNQPVQMAISRTFDVQLDPTAPGPAEIRTSEPAPPAAVIDQPARRSNVVPQSRVRDDYQRRSGLFRRGR
jgi:hypothetical protein